MVHLPPPAFTSVHLESSSPRIDGYMWRVGAAGPPHFERNTFKVRCEKVVKFSLSKVPRFNVFFDVFFKLTS